MCFFPTFVIGIISVSLLQSELGLASVTQLIVEIEKQSLNP
jgi:hypothetical protein